MRRREFMMLLGGAAIWPAGARSERVHRVAVLTPSERQWMRSVFRDALAELGYRPGSNLQIEVVSGENQLDRMPHLAKEMARSMPDAIVAVNAPGTRAAASATSRIPIVSAMVGDPVLLGFVKSIARPESNITGVANMASDITTKRAALLKEMAPKARRLALFMHPDEPIVAPQLRDIDASAASLGIEYRAFPMRTAEDLRTGLRLATEWKADSVLRLAGQSLALGPETGRLATELRLPSMLTQRQDVAAGGLMSYFADHRDLWRRVAVYVDRILKGTAPSDLPFELPTRFELVINLRTARTVGLDVPPALLARADEVVE